MARHGTENHGTKNFWHASLTGTPRHGTERRTRRFMARPGTENHGTENLGTARHGKYWHGKIMARHGPKKYHKIDFLGKIILGRKIRDFLPGSKIPLLAIHKIISHIWEDRSRKVNNDEPGFRFFTETFDLLSARPFENLVFRPESQGGQISGSP